MNRPSWSLVTRVALALATACLAVAPAIALAGGSRTQIKIGHLQDGSNTPVIADSHGVSLYMSTGDKHGTSHCYGKCTKVWKPLMANGKLVAAKGVNAKLLGTTRRKGGKRQVTYNHYPLYRYIAYPETPGAYDGQACNKDGLGDSNTRHAHWWLLNPQGKLDRGPVGPCAGY